MYDHKEAMDNMHQRIALHNDYYMDVIAEGMKVIDENGVIKTIPFSRKLKPRRSSIFLKKRIGKKRHKKEQDQNDILKWIYDLRMYLVEANGEDERVIIDQFKNKMKSANNMYFKAPLMNHYVGVAMGDTL
ncbi:hypothetical protein [Pseudomonas phage vB_PaeM_PS119XW]|uniref:Uncharacterized protein n=1 Tax=Pseudomonas phage vB_PaeM_PS119XW TaxID=2601632 RepID=A0A5C1K7R1_9CAUD|nr:hypothetical protein PP933_gp257 [Pseudomonas phage vB_PaeM_PS119XW]QEM41986.1 hypothetical protein [Pseudomonas phage vB_PaeM_PS119XW]